MENNALESLAEQAEAWARCFTRLTEALRREGLSEDQAKKQASIATNDAVFFSVDLEEISTGDVCPLCGNPSYEPGV